MRSAGQPPADRIVRVFLTCPLSPRRRRHDRFSSTAPASGCPFCRSPFGIRNPETAHPLPCRNSSGTFCSKNRTRRRPQARATSRAQRVSGSYHPAILSRESPATAGPAAINWPSQELSRFAEHTLCQIVVPRNTKKARRCAETVDDSTSLWKPEEI